MPDREPWSYKEKWEAAENCAAAWMRKHDELRRVALEVAEDLEEQIGTREGIRVGAWLSATLLKKMASRLRDAAKPAKGGE